MIGEHARRALALRANEIAPLARDDERQLLLAALQLSAGDAVLEVGAWDGYLAARLVDHEGPVTLLDRMQIGVDLLRVAYPQFRVFCGRQEALPLREGAVDRVASLVALHHVSAPAFVSEAKRVLRPGGRLAIVEVGRETVPATFLDTRVDALTKPRGHKGLYFTPAEWSARLMGAGFVDVTASLQTAHWRFATTAQAIAFCHAVFGLEATDADVAAAIMTLSPVSDETGVSWEWPLVVVTGVVPAVSESDR